MRAAAALSLLLPALAAVAAQRPDESRAERLATESLAVAIEAKDCKLAVSRLNEGLASKYPGFYLIAGTMYEEGICLKANWERAQQLYLRGLESGHRGGAYKLVAGLAHGGRDPAAAVWWAQKLDVGLASPCRVTADVHGDAERYVATLKGWPAGRLAACAYTAGVLSTVSGDLEYPRTAVAYYMVGTIGMAFVPAESRFEWQTEELQMLQMQGVVAGEQLADRNTRDARDTLRRSLEQAGERALKRFERPAGIDPGWRLSAKFIFEIKP